MGGRHPGPHAEANRHPRNRTERRADDEEKETAKMRDLVYNSFSSVLPERANLQLDAVSSVRGKYTSMLLGSGTNYWSDLKLAEAYARLGTGRKIQARLTVNPKKETKLEDFVELPLKPETLTKVHAGMQQCAEGGNGSTAERISDSIRAARAKFATKGLKFYALCKTGTATRRGPIKKGGIIVEDKRECAAFCLYLEVRDKSNPSRRPQHRHLSSRPRRYKRRQQPHGTPPSPSSSPKTFYRTHHLAGSPTSSEKSDGEVIKMPAN